MKRLDMNVFRAPIAVMVVGVCLLLGNVFSGCYRKMPETVWSDRGDTIPMRYARHLTLVQHCDGIEAIIRNPWNPSQELTRYAIRQPLKKAVVFSAVHCALLEELGAADCITGVCDAEYITSPLVRQGVQNGTIRDLGSSYQPNLEQLALLDPDALLPSAFENAGSYGGISRLGVPLIPCADYMESGPLARAEWMRFYGRLVGKGREADSLFVKVEQRYHELRNKACNVSYRPRLLAGYPYQGIWYVAGGRSTMGQIYIDAGADYVYSGTSSTGSLPMSLESVLGKAGEAQLWMFVYNSPQTMTLAQMKAENTLYSRFRAYKEQGVWACNAGNNLYHEQTPFHPDMLLEELISIIHPELGVHPRSTYFRPVE